MEKIKRNNKEVKLKNKLFKIIIAIVIILAIMAIINLVYSIIVGYRMTNKTIVATKSITTEFGTKQEIKYEIKIKNYEIQNILKEITFETEEEAKLEYSRYEIINKYELREIGVELKKKKLIFAMPEKQFKLDINYKDCNNIIDESEEETRINEEELIKCLTNQGYEIK